MDSLSDFCFIFPLCFRPVSDESGESGKDYVLGISHRKSRLLSCGNSTGLFFKDNRAFCKYICPVTVFLKPMSYFSLVRIRCDENKCISCGKCKKVCPMDVEMTDNSRKRKNGTDCILCMECVKVCPKGAL